MLELENGRIAQRVTIENRDGSLNDSQEERSYAIRILSSVVERLVHIEEVVGPIPTVSTSWGLNVFNTRGWKLLFTVREVGIVPFQIIYHSHLLLQLDYQFHLEVRVC